MYGSIIQGLARHTRSSSRQKKQLSFARMMMMMMMAFTIGP